MNSGSFSGSFSHLRYSSCEDIYEEHQRLLNGEHPKTYYSSNDGTSQIPSPDTSHTSHMPHTSSVDLKSATLIFVSLSSGAAILVLPYTVAQLGFPCWILLVLFVLSLLIFCAYLNNESTLYMLQATGITRKSCHYVRDPYPMIAELAGGRWFRLATVAAMYMTNLSACISWILLSATVLRDLLPFPYVSEVNAVRVWAVVIVSLLTPLMFLGTYSDLKVPSILAIGSSYLSAACVIANCYIAKKHLQVEQKINQDFLSNTTIDSYLNTQYLNTTIAPPLTTTVTTTTSTTHVQEASMLQNLEGIFLAYGSICFSASGASYSIPNITVLASQPKLLYKSLLTSSVFVLLIYLLTGTIPYVVFGDDVRPSITTTFYIVMERDIDVGFTFRVLTTSAQVCMTFHFMMVCLLTLNPCYQHIEDVCNIPSNMGWKRVVARTTLMVFILCVCECVPRFSPVLSVTGGVPFTLVGIIFPIVIYVKLFRVKTWQVLVFGVLLVVTIVFVIGNFASSLSNLMKRDISGF